MPGYECTGTMVLYAPAGVPEAIQARLLAATRAALGTTEIANQLEEQSFVLAPPSEPAATREHIRAHAARLAEVIRTARIRL